MVLCWSAGELLPVLSVGGDAGMLSYPFTSIDVYNPKSPAPSKHLRCGSIHWSLKWSWFRKNTAVVWPCTTLYLSPHQWESDAHLHALGASRFGGERRNCLNAVTLAFSDSFMGGNELVTGKGIARERTLGIWKPEAPFLLAPSLAVAWWKWHFSTRGSSSHPENSSSISVT